MKGAIAPLCGRSGTFDGMGGRRVGGARRRSGRSTGIKLERRRPSELCSTPTGRWRGLYRPLGWVRCQEGGLEDKKMNKRCKKEKRYV